MNLTKHGNLPITWKPHKNSEEQKLFLHFRLGEYYNPSSHGCRYGALDVNTVTREFELFQSRVASPCPEVIVSLYHIDTDEVSLRPHCGYEDNPPLLFRKEPLNYRVEGRVRCFAHLPGAGHNAITWNPASRGEKNALDDAFGEHILSYLPEILPSLRKKTMETAKANLRKWLNTIRKDASAIEAATKCNS